ncbi:hypothetical protein EAO73_05250 [Streptomyces sp. col6]|uniref:hypothetical protein n=1 Tax=Streptomyces sp. col6 TaxID=2478958 RepID=UPI0011CE2CE8|nr:hypothetical protein [Streptomyces sp. col6]TXS06784.1 hypothetical protein EAO73_05250 [Streptomyces sp. col6]
MYWRRRAVAAALVALLAVLIAWAVTSGGGKGGDHDDSKAPSGPADSITPGPSGSGPAISEQPGGSGESDGSGGGDGDGDKNGGADGGSAGSSTGTGGGSGSTDSNGGGQDTGSGSASGSGGVAAGRPVPAGSSLPDCTPGAIRLTLKTELSYAPDEKPKFRLFATNTSSTACKADFGPKSAVFTVTEAGGDDDEVWSSKDCPRKPAAVLLEVPAGTTVVHTVQWDRGRSAPKCATPPAGKAGPGTYLVEAKAPGEPVQRASFVLAKD